MRRVILLVVMCAATVALADPVRVRRPSRVHAAWAIGGFGAGSLATGLVLGIVAKAQYDQQFSNGNCMHGSMALCNADGYAKTMAARTMGAIGTAFGVIGVVALGTSTVIYLSAPRDAIAGATVAFKF